MQIISPFTDILQTPPNVVFVSQDFFSGLITLDAAYEQIFSYGPVTSQSWDSGTKEITGVEIVYLNVSTYNSASIVNISLQNLSSSGNPPKPDGIPLTQWTGSLTASKFVVGKIVEHTFTSSYTVTPNTKLGVVIKYDTFTSPSSFLPQSMGFPRGYRSSIVGVSTSTNTGSSWSNLDQIPNMRFVCSDGSRLYYKNMNRAMLGDRSISTDYQSTNTGTGIDSGDERGILWIPKKTYDITAVRMLARPTTTSSQHAICLYRDTTLLFSQSITPDLIISTTTAGVYGQTFTTPIRVYPNDNIRLTNKAIQSVTRGYRFSFNSTEDLQEFFGGPAAESNISYTNRIDDGAWNTPPSGSYSVWPIQFYGTEVTGSALLSGSSKVSGSTTANGLPVVGATVRLLDPDTGIIIVTSSNASGYYQFSNITASNYHVMVEYESGSQKYNAVSQWNI